MGRHQTMICKVCFKAMRGDNLGRHMKKHGGKAGNEDNVVTNGQGTTLGNSIRDNEKQLENMIIAQMKEFERKIELGRQLKTIVNRHNFNVNGLQRDMKEALDIYELHGKNMETKEIEWRGWQYLNKPCDRKVIWVVGKEGNEGKSFFQANIREEFGYSRVCTLELCENSRNTFHILGKLCSTNTDIFLFNLPRGGYLGTEQYKILESIKDGSAVDGKYNSQKLYFKKPNVLIVFANNEPNRSKLSKDRWIILKISKDLAELVEIARGHSSVIKNIDSEYVDTSEDERFHNDDY